MNWNWPKSKKNPDYNTWYTISRRLIFFPGVIIGLFLFVFAVGCFSGVKSAVETLKKNR